MTDDLTNDMVRTRRPPPPFRRVVVDAVEQLTPFMHRVVLAGPELAGFTLAAPAASVRLLLATSVGGTIEMPTWTGNQFELRDGRRAPIRTFTPRHFEAAQRRLTLDIVLHERGVASDWARTAAAGDIVAVSGPGRGYPIDPGCESYLLAGDETAIPAMSQLLEWIPLDASLAVHVELSHAGARLALPNHVGATVEWHLRRNGAEPGAAFATAVESTAELPAAVWVAGEAAAVQRVRRHLFDERGVARDRVSAHGYWKHGRSAT